jgi:hypothetical protein
MKGIPWRQPARAEPGWHGSRLTSNMKGVWSAKEPFVETPNGAKPGFHTH